MKGTLIKTVPVKTAKGRIHRINVYKETNEQENHPNKDKYFAYCDGKLLATVKPEHINVGSENQLDPIEVLIESAKEELDFRETGFYN